MTLEVAICSWLLHTRGTLRFARYSPQRWHLPFPQGRLRFCEHMEAFGTSFMTSFATTLVALMASGPLDSL